MIYIAKNKDDTSLNTIKDCFDVILGGKKEESRLAARKVRKLLYGSQGSGDKFGDIKNIVNSAPGNYIIISEAWRQENFVSAVSVIYYLHDRDAQPDFLFPWLLQLLEHKSGTVRYAAVRMFINELGPLTVHIRVSDYKQERLKSEQANRILQTLFVCLNNMLARLWEPKYKRYKYINSLPVSPYKSVQMVMAELEEYCGRDNIKRFTGK
jgi:hypothetical protein